ncbi:RTA1 like protein-domain-containing protein [Halteromyces radiatus]|uniref:RTA1 like protein-domain-containing protein n=1 Tax=Halteromyces radiatus TaxID=101107 RepID=UPI00221F824E|nr:RTA1 like protein-domain-containing protein [Halteromyces radiatus]KAI8086796.1 RTA1 like protein-domain-containing protein [Halteromyces radiatus]
MESKNQALLYFHYQPVNIAPQVFIALFCFIALAFIYRIHHNKSGKWLYIIPGTALAEAIGYGFRTACMYDTTLLKYVMMNLFLLLPPNALALINYKALGKVIEIQMEQKTKASSNIGLTDNNNNTSEPFWLRPKIVTWFFFSSDVFSFLVQGNGGGLLAIDGMQNIGMIIALFGLAIQLVFFGCFTMIAIYVHRQPRFDYQLVNKNHAKKKVMLCLFITIALLYIRSIYRVAEFAMGYDGPIATAEWAFYTFDTTVITMCFITYFILFIGDYFPNGNHIGLVSDSIVNEMSDMYK